MKLFLRTGKNGDLPSLYRMVEKSLEKDGEETSNKKIRTEYWFRVCAQDEVNQQ